MLQDRVEIVTGAGQGIGRVAGAVEDLVTLEALEPLTLKGFARPVPAFRAQALKG